MTDYYTLNKDRRHLVAFNSETLIGKSLEFQCEDIKPIGHPRIVIARGEDLRQVVTELFPVVTDFGHTANAYMEIARSGRNDLETRMVQFYKIDEGKLGEKK